MIMQLLGTLIRTLNPSGSKSSEFKWIYRNSFYFYPTKFLSNCYIFNFFKLNTWRENSFFKVSKNLIRYEFETDFGPSK